MAKKFVKITGPIDEATGEPIWEFEEFKEA